MIVWSIGMFILVPLAMIMLPYLIGMSFSAYSSSLFELFFHEGGLCAILFIWTLGALASFLAHVFNPFCEDELPPLETMQENNSSID